MQIQLHPTLQRFTQGRSIIDLPDDKLGNLLTSLTQQEPGLKACILDPNGSLQPYVNIYINGQTLDNYSPDQQLTTNDEIEIITSLVGG